MAELADAYGSGPYVRKNMQVQVLLSAPTQNRRVPPAAFLLYLRFNLYDTAAIEAAVNLKADVYGLVLILMNGDLFYEHSQVDV